MSNLNSLRIEPDSLSIMLTADGGAILAIDGGEVRVVLKNEHTNTILQGLLSVATIKIEPEDAT